MVNFESEFVGIKFLNFFWLVFVLLMDKEYNVCCVFEVGWGGVVWKIFGEEGFLVVNVNGFCYGVIYGVDWRLLGLNNIELIMDCLFEVNFEEMLWVKWDYLDYVLVVFVMVFCEEDLWKKIFLMIVEIGCDGFEFNFGCLYGMVECGMGFVVG